MVKKNSCRSCLFVEGVMCSHRRSKRFSVAKFCLECPIYLRFMREMEAEDEKVMVEIDREKAMLDAEQR